MVNETNPINSSSGLSISASANLSRDSILNQDSITSRVYTINQLRTEIQNAGLRLGASTIGTSASQATGVSFGASTIGTSGSQAAGVSFGASTVGTSGSLATTKGLGSSTYLGGPQLEISTEERPRYNPGLHLPGFERNDPGTRIDYSDRSYLISALNEDGLLEETLVKSDNSRTVTTYEDLPGDKNSTLPKGFRATILKQDPSGRIIDNQTVSVIYNKLDDNKFSAIATDLTDPESPQHIYSSLITKLDMEDASANNLYDTNTSFVDGSRQRIENSLINSEAGSYGQTITSTSSSGTSSSTRLQFVTQKNTKGFNKTNILNLNNPASPTKIASFTSPDTSILRERKLGSEISQYLDSLNDSGLLDITGDGQVSPYTDLLLINRYNQGLRGSALMANINFGSSSPNISTIESRLNEAFSRGVYDIDGSESEAKIGAQAHAEDLSVEVSDRDINLIARYMFGARQGALTDPRNADDTSIPINGEASNLLLVNANDPLVLDYQQIFAANGVNFSTSGRDLVMFYVSQENRSEGSQDPKPGAFGVATPDRRPANRIVLPKDLAPEGSTHG